MSVFLGSNRQHMPVCARTISSWVRKVLSIAKAHVSPGTFQDAVVSVTMVVDLSLMSILQACD